MLVTARATSALRNTEFRRINPAANRPQARNFINSIFTSLGPCPLRTLNHTKTLPYSSSSIFKAVSDVSGYPSFLPFAVSSQIIARDSNGYPTRARLTIGYEKLGLEEQWDSIVHCDPSQGSVEARSSESNSEGLFEVLKTKWKINSLQQSTAQSNVTLDVDVKFRNPLYDQMFAQVEKRVAATMIAAFENRVKELEARKT